MMLTPTYLTTNHQKTVHELIMPSFTVNTKLITIFPKWGCLVLRALALCVPPFA